MDGVVWTVAQQYPRTEWRVGRLSESLTANDRTVRHEWDPPAVVITVLAPVAWLSMLPIPCPALGVILGPHARWRYDDANVLHGYVVCRVRAAITSDWGGVLDEVYESSVP